MEKRLKLKKFLFLPKNDYIIVMNLRSMRQTMNKEKQVWQKLEEVMDPEFPLNIVEMGLIYDVTIEEDTGNINIVMTLTTPGCPLHSRINDDISNKLKELDWVNEVDVKLVFDPRWTIDMMTEEARRKIGR